MAVPRLSAMPTLDSRLDGVVGTAAKTLERAFGMKTVGDLLGHYPRRYARRGELTPILTKADPHRRAAAPLAIAAVDRAAPPLAIAAVDRAAIADRADVDVSARGGFCIGKAIKGTVEGGWRLRQRQNGIADTGLR